MRQLVYGVMCTCSRACFSLLVWVTLKTEFSRNSSSPAPWTYSANSSRSAAPLPVKGRPVNELVLALDVNGKTADTKVFQCPVAPDASQWIPKFGSGLPAQDGYLKNEFHLRVRAGRVFMSYGHNCYGSEAAIPQVGLGVLNLPVGSHAFGPQKASNVLMPSQMIMLGDSNWDVEKGGDTKYSGFIADYGERQWPLELHNVRANLAWADGHVEARKRKSFISGLVEPQTQAAKDAVNRLWNTDNHPHYKISL